MSDNASEDEPTMEEILASIRRIISDESEDEALEAAPEEDPVEEEADEAPEPEPEPVPDPEPEPEPIPEPEPEPEPVEDLELEEPEPEPVFAPEPEPEPVHEPEPAPVYEPEPVEEDVFELTDFATAGEVEAIVSPPVEERAGDTFAHLTQMMVAGYDGDNNTLEALVRSMLKPMLQGWLDENLPSIVQDAVEREVARIARRQ
ncbi:MAG: DUF2497 domain-containing protein [Kordiimonas sp.]